MPPESTINLSTAELREHLLQEGLVRENLDLDPVRQFEHWYQQALKTDLYEPTAMSLATVDTNGQPWQRMVLLKLFDRKGFVFFTNYGSRKATHIKSNAKVSLLFPWQAIGRQVKITGDATKITAIESLKYFVSRPRGSQIGAWSSPQSQIINSRAVLETMVEQAKQKYADNEIPLPDFWGGYRVKPSTFEFWQARENRLHDQFIYQKQSSAAWKIERLAP